MAIITKSNFLKLVLACSKTQTNTKGQEIFKEAIYFFNSKEQEYLLAAKSLLQNGDEILNQLKVNFSQIKSEKDNLVYRNNYRPAIHADHDCARLTSNYKNFIIPDEIRIRVLTNGGNDQDVENEFNKFRAWFGQKEYLIASDPDQFLRELDIRWNIQRKIQDIEYSNSGSMDLAELNVNDLEKKISDIITAEKMFYLNNKEVQPLVRRFKTITGLAYMKDAIRNNDTGLTDAELKNFLKAYDKRFKKPIKNLLLQYYITQYNPTLEFSESLLMHAGFHRCQNCMSENQFRPVFNHSASVAKKAS